MKEVTVILLPACSHCIYLKTSYHNMILTHILGKKKMAAEMLVSASGYNAKNQTVSYICLIKPI